MSRNLILPPQQYVQNVPVKRVVHSQEKIPSNSINTNLARPIPHMYNAQSIPNNSKVTSQPKIMMNDHMPNNFRQSQIPITKTKVPIYYQNSISNQSHNPIYLHQQFPPNQTLIPKVRLSQVKQNNQPQRIRVFDQHNNPVDINLNITLSKDGKVIGADVNESKVALSRHSSSSKSSKFSSRSGNSHFRNNHLNLNLDVEQQILNCVICHQTYSVSQKQKHIAKHQQLQQLSKSKCEQKILHKSCFLKKSNKQAPIIKPIVAPEEYNIQYQPNQFIIEKSLIYKSNQISKPQKVQMADSQAQITEEPRHKSMNLQSKRSTEFQQRQPQDLTANQNPQICPTQQLVDTGAFIPNTQQFDRIQQDQRQLNGSFDDMSIKMYSDQQDLQSLHPLDSKQSIMKRTLKDDYFSNNQINKSQLQEIQHQFKQNPALKDQISIKDIIQDRIPNKNNNQQYARESKKEDQQKLFMKQEQTFSFNNKQKNERESQQNFIQHSIPVQTQKQQLKQISQIPQHVMQLNQNKSDKSDKHSPLRPISQSLVDIDPLSVQYSPVRAQKRPIFTQPLKKIEEKTSLEQQYHKQGIQKQQVKRQEENLNLLNKNNRQTVNNPFRTTQSITVIENGVRPIQEQKDMTQVSQIISTMRGESGVQQPQFNSFIEARISEPHKKEETDNSKVYRNTVASNTGKKKKIAKNTALAWF